MMDRETLEYDFDEERGFGEPKTPDDVQDPHAGLNGAEKLGWGLIALGLLSLVIQVAGSPLTGTWLGFTSAILLPAIGASILFWGNLKDTNPGIKHDGVYFKSALSQGAVGWMLGIGFTAFYVLLYWYPTYLGHDPGGKNPTGLVAIVDPLARVMTNYPASQWFLYGVFYTLAIAVFGIRMIMKYRHNRYQIIRTLSVTFFQFAFAWLLPNLLVYFRYPYMEFNGVWQLKHDYLWPSKVGEFLSAGAMGTFLLIFAVALVIATPILTYFYGKRWYCSWVCGCGGLAETLGDPWRQLSSKSTTAWKIERWMIHSVLVLVVAVTALLWAEYQWGILPGATGGYLKQWYGFAIGAVFSGVIGVGFYPLLGSRVWCRFGCPQAAILGIFQRFFSRFRITTNGGQCMSCGNCSTYCEMGIDVRAYAQSGENIVRASCVGCGVCSAVCPRGVLKLEGGTHADRFDGASKPLTALIESLKEPDIYRYESWDGHGAPPERKKR
ncbi:MAG: 4Fe-4S dicluster domain-containing protein [Planctomycetota bacterium]